MEERSVTIYKRPNGRVFLHRHDRTTMGILLACPPFLTISPDEVGRISDLVGGLLDCPPHTVEHPKLFNQLEPLFVLAGCRNWKEFARGTVCYHVQQSGCEISIIPTKKEGLGFQHLPNEIVRFERAAISEQLLRVLAPK